MHHLGKLLAHSAPRWSDRPFLIGIEKDELRRTLYGEFRGQVLAWAAFLKERGVGRGDRVGIVSHKSPHQLRALYACWHLGAVAVPVCEGLGDREMGFVFKDAEPRIVLVDETLAGLAARNCGSVPTAGFGELPMTPPAVTPEIAELDADAVAVLIYTSGSTGCPKGVMLTHKNLYRNAECTLSVINMEHGREVLLSLLPYWHSYALVVEAVASVMVGLAVAIPKDIRDFRKNIGRYAPTIVLLVPRIADVLRSGIMKQVEESDPAVKALFQQALHNASRIFTHDPRLDGGILRILSHHVFYDPVVFGRVRGAFGGRLKFFISGGAPLDLEHQLFFKQVGIPIYQGYGLSEASPIISTNPEHAHRLGSCGRPMPWLFPEHGGDFTFLAADGASGKNLHGELAVRGDCVMKGYWRHADDSAKTVKDGWLHTGDIGRLDPDGYLHIDGRKSNMLVLAGGEKLHPEHVEEAIRTDRLFRDVMVIGDKCQNVYACVSLDDTAAAAIPEAGRAAEARKRVLAATAHLAPFQRPKDVLLLPPLRLEDGTVTATLKLRRFRVWELHGGLIRDFLTRNGEDAAAGAR